MAGVGAGADAVRAAFGHLQNLLRIPIGARIGMIVDGHVDLEFLAELFHDVESFFVRIGLGNDSFQTHLLGPVEHFAAGGFILAQRHDAVVHGFHVGIAQLLEQLADHLRGHFMICGLGVVLGEFLPRKQLDVMDAQEFEGVDGLQK